MAELAVELGDEAIKEQAEKFGFNASFDLLLTSMESSYRLDGLDDAQTGLTGFGQGQVDRHAVADRHGDFAGLANEGAVMNPTMVDEVVGPDLSAQQTTQPTEFGEALAPDLAAEMVEMMTANVSSGVASNARDRRGRRGR